MPLVVILSHVGTMMRTPSNNLAMLRLCWITIEKNFYGFMAYSFLSHLLKIRPILANDLRHTSHIASGKSPDWLWRGPNATEHLAIVACSSNVPLGSVPNFIYALLKKAICVLRGIKLPTGHYNGAVSVYKYTLPNSAFVKERPAMFYYLLKIFWRYQHTQWARLFHIIENT